MSHQRTGVVVAAIAMGNARNPLDMAWHQRFSGVAQATRALAEHRDKLDPDMGVWCDSVRNRQSEKAGAVKSLQQ